MRLPRFFVVADDFEAFTGAFFAFVERLFAEERSVVDLDDGRGGGTRACQSGLRASISKP